MTDWTSLTYVVVDVEGNGQHPPDLVELAIVPITGGVIGRPRSWLVKPSRPITAMARRIHGITNAAVDDAPAFSVVRDEVVRALEADALVAHNAHVDLDVLARTLGDWKPLEVFDTLKLARRLLPDTGAYKLGALVEALRLAEDLPDGLTPHRATYDVMVTAWLFLRLATPSNARPLTLEQLRGAPTGAADDEPAVLF